MDLEYVLQKLAYNGMKNIRIIKDVDVITKVEFEIEIDIKGVGTRYYSDKKLENAALKALTVVNTGVEVD